MTVSDETTNTGRTVIHVEPDEFKDVLWPAKTDINVYISGATAKTTKNGDKLVLNFVVADDQTNPDVKALAGTSLEVWFGTTGRPQEKKLYRKLLFAAFGGLQSFEPESLNGLPFVVQVTHGKPDTEGEVRMFLESLRAEGA
jgi:hypothetical protein